MKVLSAFGPVGTLEVVPDKYFLKKATVFASASSAALTTYASGFSLLWKA